MHGLRQDGLQRSIAGREPYQRHLTTREATAHMNDLRLERALPTLSEETAASFRAREAVCTCSFFLPCSSLTYRFLSM